MCIISLSLYINKEEKSSPKLEFFSLFFFIFIFLRNLIHFFKLYSAVKNQRNIKVILIYLIKQKNIEEIINFTGVISERKFEIIPNENSDKKPKNNEALSFVYEETIQNNNSKYSPKKNYKKEENNLKENEVDSDIIDNV